MVLGCAYPYGNRIKLDPYHATYTHTREMGQLNMKGRKRRLLDYRELLIYQKSPLREIKEDTEW